ncbi:LOW QUALITY PROTEIN: protein NUCLEAR FUSION DEFECTIVE 4-like [Setaria viridis]|uniref:LOW QUALITY PROTEIN: protein NUCLEAR FUSION DEFECTIVE 4-like n=1 Tax=Setaria viridis TaxID=4556 RepID=UPI003B39FB59
MPLPRGGEVEGGGRRRIGGGDGDDDEAWRRWAVLVATVWIQALTGTNFDFSAYSSALKSSLGISQEALNYLATASDLGKALGWSSGLALLHMPLHGVLLVSAALGLAAYAAQYCCLVFLNPSSSLAIPYPLVFLVCLIAGCSICWFNTVCFVLCIRSFSASNRPLALSLSISFNGLSAAFYTLFANAFSPTSPSVYLLLNAILPLAASILALPAILLCHTHDSHLQSVPRYDRRVFLGLYILAFITGIYLVVFGSLNTTRAAAWVILTGAMVLLALPLIIPACSSCSYVDTHSIDSASHDDPHKPLLVSNHLQNESNAVMEKSMEQQLQGSNCGTILDKGRLVVLGEEHSAKRLIGCVDFWLYYTAYFCGATVGLVYSNNLGQIAQSLHQQSQLTMLLAVYSSFSFFGRLLSALPDFLHRKVTLARTGWLAAALVPMPMALFLMQKQQDGSTLAVGTALIGLSSGFIFAAAVSVTSELFGPNSIGVNHNILITNIPLGSLLYGQIAALVYDANGQRMRVTDNHTGMIDTMIVCMGVKCYSTTFFVWGCITLLGLASSIVLFIRTKPAYASTASRQLVSTFTNFPVNRETP